MPINPGQPQVRSLLQLLGWQEPNTGSGGGRRSASPSASGGGGGGGGDLSQLGDIGAFRGGPAGGQLEPWANATAGAAPAYNPGTTYGGYNAVFDPRAPSSQGGFFKLSDYFAQDPNIQSWDPRIDRISTASNGLSTNNWRLLGNDPDQFLINGTIINRREMGRQLAPKSVLGTEGTGFPGYSYGGGGIWSYPFGSQGQHRGYIGADNMAITSTPTT